MTGQHEILRMRREGVAPLFVWVSDFTTATLDGMTVCVAGDTPELEDFRFLVGLTALVEGADGKRVERIAACCGKHAKRVIASVIQPVNKWHWETKGVNDSKGVMTWP
jgi:hypothetical protein